MMGVKIVSKAHVKPSKPVGRREYCQLATFDLAYIAFYYNQKLLVYKGSGTESDFQDRVERLKDGLREVLGEFYDQLAGKLGKDEDGVLREEYDDEMAGVEVAVATSKLRSVISWWRTALACKLKDLVPYNGVVNVEGLHRPLLAVQFTKLKDGLAMGCAFNHAILDGTSMWHFMTSWAQIYNGAQTISVPPFLDRTKARNTRIKLNLPLAPETSSPDPPVRVKVFKFSESAIDQIKATANSNPNPKPFSTFQSLSAHVWRAVTRARNLKPDDTAVFYVFANCRHRVDPPVPLNYFGNLIQPVVTRTSAGLLLENPAEFGAGMIRKAIEMHDAKAIKAWNIEWESKVLGWKDVKENCVVVGNSPQFKVYDVDFGWGKPEVVRMSIVSRKLGNFYLLYLWVLLNLSFDP